MDSHRPRRGSIYTPAYQYLMKRLRDARIAAGYTQVEVASALRRPKSFVSKCELGERKVDPIDLMEFAIVYKQPYVYFLPPKDLLVDPPAVRLTPSSVGHIPDDMGYNTSEDDGELMFS